MVAHNHLCEPSLPHVKNLARSPCLDWQIWAWRLLVDASDISVMNYLVDASHNIEPTYPQAVFNKPTRTIIANVLKIGGPRLVSGVVIWVILSRARSGFQQLNSYHHSPSSDIQGAPTDFQDIWMYHPQLCSFHLTKVRESSPGGEVLDSEVNERASRFGMWGCLNHLVSSGQSCEVRPLKLEHD